MMIWQLVLIVITIIFACVFLASYLKPKASAGEDDVLLQNILRIGADLKTLQEKIVYMDASLAQKMEHQKELTKVVVSEIVEEKFNRL